MMKEYRQTSSKGSQPLEGLFVKKQSPATVVSAYYEMKSKHTPDEYRKWIRIFLETVPCHLIFFTESVLEGFIRDCRRNYMDRTKIIVMERNEWTANKKFSEGVWIDLYGKDPERDLVSPEVYKVWYEKKEFVMRGIAMNPWAHTDFLWVDAGMCRTMELATLVKEFPVASRIPVDRILLLNIMKFSRNDEIIKHYGDCSIMGGVDDKPRIGGGIIAGTAALWKNYSESFDTVVEKYRKVGAFWGKEQIIMKTVVLENRSMFSLLEVKPIAPENWFYSLLYLGCSENIFRIINDPLRNSIKRTYAYLHALPSSI